MYVWGCVFAHAQLSQSTQHLPVPTLNATDHQLPDAPAPSPSSGPLRSPVFPVGKALLSASTAATKPRKGFDPNAPVTVPENTIIHVRNDRLISTQDTQEGESLSFTVSDDVLIDDVVIIPRGAVVYGTVVQCTKAGTFSGSPTLIIRLTSLDLEAISYPLYSYQLTLIGQPKNKQTEATIIDGSVLGGLAGNAIAKNIKGRTTTLHILKYVGSGAAIGASAGLIISAKVIGPVITIPAESQLDFYLSSPASIVPVSPEEMDRLALRIRPIGSTPVFPW